MESLPLSGQLAWHKSTPPEVARARCWSDGSEGWAAWVKHLRQRDKPARLALFTGKRSPLVWALPEDLASGETAERIARLHAARPKKCQPEALAAELQAWLAETGDQAADAAYALEALAWCHALPRLARVLPAQSWWSALERLIESSRDAAALGNSADPYLHQLLAGELPLTLACLFREIKPCRKLAGDARAALASGLEQLLDGEGLPSYRYLEQFRRLLACWTRARSLGEQTRGGSWNEEAQSQYEWAVRQALFLSRPDGSQVFSNGADGGWEARMFKAALRYGGDHGDHEIAAVALPGKLATSTEPAEDLPPAAGNSEWSSLAVLRSGWPRSEPQLAVNYGGRGLTAELNNGRARLLSGPCPPQISLDGRPAELNSAWECVCWESDEDVDYLELEANFAGGLRVQRQMLLAREDRFLLLADAVLGTRPAAIDYALRLPLAGGVSAEPAAVTFEVYLHAGAKRNAAVLPLALPEWRRGATRGKLAAREGALELRQAAQARCLYAPLFFDLQPRRLASQLTWRQLTIAQSLAVQPPEVAAGYRVQVGKKQWLIYRSLAPKASRTLLGVNIANEFLCGRFQRNGEVDELLEIE